MGSSINTGSSSEVIKNVATKNDLDDISLTQSLKKGVLAENKPDIGVEEINHK